MTDMARTADMLETSTRLQTTADVLKRLASGVTTQQLHPGERLVLAWATDFLADLDSQAFKHGTGGRMTVEAAEARPTFYRTLNLVIRDLGEHQISSRADVLTFLDQLHEFLRHEGSSPVNTDRVRLAARFLEEFAESLLTQLWREHSPRRTPSGL
jgi:hypothetical protein